MDMASGELDAAEADALTRSTLSLFEQYVNLSKKIPSEVITTVSGIEDANRLADTIASHMTLSLEQKQDVLEIADLTGRFEHLMSLMEAEIDLFQIEQRIRGRVKKQMEKESARVLSQRADEGYPERAWRYRRRCLGAGPARQENCTRPACPRPPWKKPQSELAKLKMMSPMSAEASVLRNYIDCMIGVPWKNRTRVKHDLIEAETTLNLITTVLKR